MADRFNILDSPPTRVIADGTAAAPSIAFANDQDTGMYRVTSNQLALVAGAAQVIYVDNGGVTVTQTLNVSDTKNISFSTTTGSIIAATASQKMGFWGKTPIVQPTRAGQLTDNSGGTSGGNTIASVAAAPVDTNAASLTSTRNAIATLAARLNDIEAKLSAAAGGVGITA